MSKQTYMLMLLAFLLNLPAADSSLADEAEVYDALRCISVRSVKRTEVVNDLSILFFTKGKTVYLNILPKQCKGLSRDRRISYSSSVGRLCISDNIRILSDMGGGLQEGRACRLGYFHPPPKRAYRLPLTRCTIRQSLRRCLRPKWKKSV